MRIADLSIIRLQSRSGVAAWVLAKHLICLFNNGFRSIRDFPAMATPQSSRYGDSLKSSSAIASSHGPGPLPVIDTKPMPVGAGQTADLEIDTRRGGRRLRPHSRILCRITGSNPLYIRLLCRMCLPRPHLLPERRVGVHVQQLSILLDPLGDVPANDPDQHGRVTTSPVADM